MPKGIPKHPKPKHLRSSVVGASIGPKHRKIWDQIENKSAFLQLCLEGASSIMAWAILRDRDPDKYPEPKHPPDTLQKFNERFPSNDLTKIRRGKKPSPENSKNPPELW